MKGRVTIIGLGCVGTSIGLALREQEPDLEVMGHDIETAHSSKAARIKAVHKTDWNLPAACEGADLVILALPLPAVRETLQVLGPHLKEGCVVTDTATHKTSVLEWARHSLPDHVHFVTGTPLPGPAVTENEWLSGPEAARADLFEEGVYCITPSHDTDPQAVSKLLELIRALGAKPLFLDPLEYDGLQAGVGDLPALLAVALLRATVDSPGWMEMRKVAGYDFAALTGPAAAGADARFDAVLANRENVVRRLDMLIAELGRMRRMLSEQADDSLREAYTDAAAARIHWLEERAVAWEETPDLSDIPGIGEQIRRVLFGGFSRRKPPET